MQQAERARLLAALGEDAMLLADPDKLAETLEQRFRDEPAASWAARLDASEVPVEVVDEAFCRELFDDPDAERDQLVARTWAGAVGRFEDPGLLVTFSDTPGVVQRGPSMCGEHTRQLMAELGYTDAEVDALAEARAILDAPVTRS